MRIASEDVFTFGDLNPLHADNIIVNHKSQCERHIGFVRYCTETVEVASQRDLTTFKKLSSFGNGAGQFGVDLQKL